MICISCNEEYEEEGYSAHCDPRDTNEYWMLATKLSVWLPSDSPTMQSKSHMLNKEDIEYLVDFLNKTLLENDESDPFDLEEAEYLIELKNKLKEMLWYGQVH